MRTDSPERLVGGPTDTGGAAAGNDELTPAPAEWLATIDSLQVSEALRESEARLQALLSSLEDLVFELDEDGTYLAVWTTDHTLLARPRSELLGRTVTEVVGGELGGRFVSAIRSVLESGRTSFIDYCLDVPAGRVYFQGRIAPIAGATNPGRVCFFPATSRPRSSPKRPATTQRNACVTRPSTTD